MTPFEAWCADHGANTEDWFLTNSNAKKLCVPIGSEVGIATDDGSVEPYFYIKDHGHRYLRLDMIEVKPKH